MKRIILSALLTVSATAAAAPVLVNETPFRPTLNIDISGDGLWRTMSYITLTDVRAGQTYLATANIQVSNNLAKRGIDRPVMFSSGIMAQAALQVKYFEPFDAGYLGHLAPWGTVNVTPQMHHYSRAQTGFWTADQDYPVVHLILFARSSSGNRLVQGRDLDVDNATLQAMQVN